MYYGLLLFFVLEYVRPTSYLPFLLVLRLNSIVPLAVSIGSLFKSTPVSNHDLLEEPNTKIVGAFFVLIGLSVLTADVTLYAYTVFTTVLGYVLAYVAIVKIATSLSRLKGVFLTLVFVHVLVAALSPQIFSGDTRAFTSSGFFLGDGNDFALSVNIAIALCVFLLFDAKGVWRALYIAALGVLVLCVVFTQSRGGTIALACVGFYFWLKMDKKMTMAMVVAVAGVVVLLAAPPAYFERMNTISTEEGSAQGRLFAWGGAIRMAFTYPLAGVGAGNFPTAYGARFRASSDIPQANAHSIFFQVLGELGFPGLIVLITFFVWNLIANRRLALAVRARDPVGGARDIRLLASTSAAAVSFGVAGGFLSAVYYPHLYVLAGLLAAARRVVRDHSVAAAPSAPAAKEISLHWALRPQARPTPAPNLGRRLG